MWSIEFCSIFSRRWKLRRLWFCVDDLWCKLLEYQGMGRQNYCWIHQLMLHQFMNHTITHKNILTNQQNFSGGQTCGAKYDPPPVISIYAIFTVSPRFSPVHLWRAAGNTGGKIVLVIKCNLWLNFLKQKCICSLYGHHSHCWFWLIGEFTEQKQNCLGELVAECTLHPMFVLFVTFVKQIVYFALICSSVSRIEHPKVMDEFLWTFWKDRFQEWTQITLDPDVGIFCFV